MRRLLLQFAFVVLPKLVAGGSTALISLLLIRHLAPAVFGVVALCLSALLIADALLGSAFDLAAVRLASDDTCSPADSLRVQWAATCLKLIAIVTASVCAMTLYGRINRAVFHGGCSRTLLALTLLAAAAILLLRSVQLNLQIAQRFRAYGLVDLTQSALKIGGVAMLLHLGSARPEAVLALYAAAPLSVVAVWLFTTGGQLPLRTVPVRAMRQTMRFASWFLLTFALGTLLGRMDLWLVAHYTSLRDAGIYSAAQALAAIPPMLGTYLSIILSPRVVRLLQAGRLLHFSVRLQSLLALLAVLCYAAALVLLPRMSSAVPLHFRQAIPVLRLLLPGALAGMISFPLTLTTLLFLSPRFLFVLDCISAPVIVLSYTLVLPRFGLGGAACVFSVAALARAVIAQIAAFMIVARTERRAAKQFPASWSATPVEAASL